MASQKPFERSGFDDAIPHHIKTAKKELIL
jgi:hypothetical protein